jgi:adenosylmethionine-8-amino-7-oxononanoate aminotransferase
LSSDSGHYELDRGLNRAAEQRRLPVTDRALELAQLVLDITPPACTTMKFLSGGSEAVEAALKMARQFGWTTGAR